MDDRELQEIKERWQDGQGHIPYSDIRALIAEVERLRSIEQDHARELDKLRRKLGHTRGTIYKTEKENERLQQRLDETSQMRFERGQQIIQLRKEVVELEKETECLRDKLNICENDCYEYRKKARDRHSQVGGFEMENARLFRENEQLRQQLHDAEIANDELRKMNAIHFACPLLESQDDEDGE